MSRSQAIDAAESVEHARERSRLPGLCSAESQMGADFQSEASEGVIQLGDAGLFVREVGEGRPVIVLHGGPEFDHTYLLPDLDRLSDSCRLIYYDQRGRGRSSAGVQPEDVSVGSELDDLEALREHVGAKAVAILGHSWGGTLGMLYALRHPDRVSHLILLNSAFASYADRMVFRRERVEQTPDVVEELAALGAGADYQAGDPDAVADFCRVHFRWATRRPEERDAIVERLRASFTREGILKGRAIEDRLCAETWGASDWTLLPALAHLEVPTLVIHGDQDLIPLSSARHIAEAIPGARLVVLKECGHFSHLESPNDVHETITRFLREAQRAAGQ